MSGSQTLSGNKNSSTNLPKSSKQGRILSLDRVEADELVTPYSTIAKNKDAVSAYVDREFGFTRDFNRDLSRLDGWKNPYKWLDEKRGEDRKNADAIASLWQDEFDYYYKRGYSEKQCKKYADKIAKVMRERFERRSKVDFPDGPSVKNPKV